MLDTVYQLLDALLSQWIAQEVQHLQALVIARCLGHTATPSVGDVATCQIQLSGCSVGVDCHKGQVFPDKARMPDNHLASQSIWSQAYSRT